MFMDISSFFALPQPKITLGSGLGRVPVGFSSVPRFPFRSDAAKVITLELQKAEQIENIKPAQKWAGSFVYMKTQLSFHSQRAPAIKGSTRREEKDF
jgi:hypothetical protein